MPIKWAAPGALQPVSILDAAGRRGPGEGVNVTWAHAQYAVQDA